MSIIVWHRIWSLDLPFSFDFLKRELTPGRPDIGYIFYGPQEIRPFAEQPRTGPTSIFISELAARLRCHVIAGYPEALPADEDNDPRYGAYNSAVICGPSGEYIGGGRKTNMYVADLPWCKPGTLLLLTTELVLIHHIRQWVCSLRTPILPSPIRLPRDLYGHQPTSTEYG